QVLSRGGEVLSREVLQPPRSGGDVTLTIDPQLQQAAEQLLDSALARRAVLQTSKENIPAGGAVVVLDCIGGEILALAAAPRFNPIHFSRGDSAELTALLADPSKP